MTKETLVLVLGIAVFFTPFLGLPYQYKEWVFIVSGILLIAIGYRLRRQVFLESLQNGEGERRGDVFVESTVIEKKPVTEDENSNGIV